jgi:hypothetical protein
MLEAAAVPKLQRRQQLLSADNDSNKEISMSPAMRHPTTQTRHTHPKPTTNQTGLARPRTTHGANTATKAVALPLLHLRLMNAVKLQL